jgi:hypothetical protein
VTGGWRKLHNEELHNLIILIILGEEYKSRRMGCAGHVARMEKRNAYMILVGKRQLEDQHVGTWTILKWILDKMGWIGLIWLRIWTSGGFL